MLSREPEKSIQMERGHSVFSQSWILWTRVREGRSYRLQHQWVGVVNRSQQDTNKIVDMIADKRREREYFVSSHDYGHLVSKMGSEYLGKVLSKPSSGRAFLVYKL